MSSTVIVVPVTPAHGFGAGGFPPALEALPPAPFLGWASLPSLPASWADRARMLVEIPNPAALAPSQRNFFLWTNTPVACTVGTLRFGGLGHNGHVSDVRNGGEGLKLQRGKPW